MDIFSVALDGPAGAGKSTIAKRLAKELKCTYIDTGAMYRSIGFFCIKEGIDYHLEKEVSRYLNEIDICFSYSEGKQLLYLNGEEVFEQIRTDEVAKAASKVATYQAVREKLVDLQRQLAAKQSVVMDGRDIGTVVLPGATLKLFLTADLEERAKRRYTEYQDKNRQVSMEEIKKQIEARDRQDIEREVSPLKKAKEAVEIDTTGLCVEEIIKQIKDLLQKRL